jgi:NAD(P)H-dependent FMN reductase
MASRKIAVIVGSLRKESYNRKVAKTLMLLAGPELDMEIVEIGQLPLYNEDDDANPPAAWTEFRDRIKTYDGVLFVTPDYTRSAPGAEGRNVDHICFRVESFDASAIAAHLAAAGITAGKVESRYGAEGEGPSIYLQDPENNTIELKGPPSPLR